MFNTECVHRQSNILLCHRQLAIGCSEHLCIWETRTGNLLQKFTMSGVTSINALCYSPNGAHLAVGLSSGEVQVFEILSSSPIFFLPATNVRILISLMKLDYSDHQSQNLIGICGLFLHVTVEITSFRLDHCQLCTIVIVLYLTLALPP